MTTKISGKRSSRAEMARTTLEALDNGGYTNVRREWVDIKSSLAHAMQGSRGFAPDASLPPVLSRRYTTHVEVRPTSTISALRQLQADGAGHIACLNFASAKNPGGGFLNGALAQEESLAAASGLYPCLLIQPAYYETNRVCGTCLYTDWIIWSPDIPFLRSDDGTWLDAPFTTGVITAPAPNAGAVHRNEPERADEILPTLRRRAQRVLHVAAAEGVDALVLGAWGCGVFRNDPAQVAQVFAELLGPDGPFGGTFQRVVFAIYDSSSGTPVLNAFQAAFPSSPMSAAPKPTVTLYRPVGPAELELISASAWKRFPPRLPDQPIFYPVLNEVYAAQIARDWNVAASGSGHVLKFEIDAVYISRFDRQVVGGSQHEELWVPAEELEEFNDHIVGTIEVVANYGPQ
ncbi:TIGR02452 family protein [Verrucomicrobium spinosum]|uniref:TIGR02452 family protein n=1 Tax=Verrucomicrobium spinosum TaxID=2736 RepID=UPI000174498F|nr:TIGR02452 family protein [Verrucomicrobium spinosum]